MKKRFIHSDKIFIELDNDGGSASVTSGELGTKGYLISEGTFQSTEDALEAAENMADAYIQAGYRLVMDQPDVSRDEHKRMYDFREKVEWDEEKAVGAAVKKMDLNKLHPHNRDYVLAMGLMAAEKLSDGDLRRSCLEKTDGTTDSKELAFWLACEAGRAGDKSGLLKHAHHAIELGTITAEFADSHVLAPFMLDDEFRTAIRVEDVGDAKYYLINTGKDKKIRSENRDGLIGFTVHPDRAEEGVLNFKIDTKGCDPPHVIITDLWNIFLVSKPFFKALGKAVSEGTFTISEPVFLRDGKKELDGYRMLRLREVYDVTDNELTRSEWEYFGHPLVLHDMKLKSSYVMFAPYDAGPIVIRGDIYSKLVKAVPPEKWGVDITPLKISDHKPLPTAKSMSAKEWHEKGRVHYNAGQIDMAKECVDRMTQAYPDFASGWNLAGVVYKRLGRDRGYKTEESGYPEVRQLYDKAVECLNRALELEPTMVRAWQNLGVVYDELKYKVTDKSEERLFVEKTIECYRKALELDKSDETYVALLEHVRGDEYHNTLEKWAAEVPPSPHPLGVRGESHYSEGKYEKAIDLLSRSIAIKPTARSYYYLAYSYLQTGELDKMEETIGKFTPDLLGYGYRQLSSDEYVDELKGRLRAARKKLEKKASPPKPAVFEKTKLFDALEKRYNELWESLNDIPAELMQMLKVKPDDLRDAFASLDDDAIVASYKDDLEDALSRFEDEDKRGALILEWYYDGPDGFHSETMGALSHECHAEDNDDPDQEPELSYGKEVYGFDAGEAIGIWSVDLCEEYRSNEDDIPKKFANRYSSIEDTYHEIAEFRLFMIAARAYAMVTDTKPPYFFLGTHEDTPHMIVSPGKERSKSKTK